MGFTVHHSGGVFRSGIFNFNTETELVHLPNGATLSAKNRENWFRRFRVVGSQIYKCSAVAEMGDRLATIDMGRKLGAAVPLWGAG